MITDRDDSANLIYIECETGVHKTARSLQMKKIIYIYISTIDGPLHWYCKQELGRSLAGCEEATENRIVD